MYTKQTSFNSEHFDPGKTDTQKKTNTYVRWQWRSRRTPKVLKVDRLMQDSGNTSHMAPNIEQLQNKQPFNVNISLLDDYKVKATSTGTLVVH